VREKCKIELGMDIRVLSLFNAKFGGVNRVASEIEADEFIKKVDEWWNENHFESPEEYSFRVDNFNRPSIGIVIDYKEI
jgi:hypothetical protein